MDKKKYFKKKYERKIKIINNAIDINYWKRNNNNKKINGNQSNCCVGFIGRISPEKGWEEFVNVAYHTLAHEKKITFVIAGDGPDKRKMQDLVNKYLINDKFDFRGIVTDMKSFYNEIDLVLSASRTEGLSVALLESNAMGIPVIATNVGGINELIEHGYNGYLTEAGDIKMLSKYLLELSNNPDKREIMGNNGIKRVKNRFDITDKIKEIERLYYNIII